MATKTVQDSSLTAIADAIRAKTGKSASMEFPTEFVSEIGSISGGEDLIKKKILGQLTEYIGDMEAGHYVPWALAHFGHLVNVRISNIAGEQTYFFQDCGKLKTVDLSFVQNARLGNLAFASCSALETVVLRKPGGIWSLGNGIGANFNTLVLDSTAVVTAYNNGVFNNVPAFKSGGTGGTIYIPKVLYDHLGDGTNLDYKSATNWSIFDGYGTITWAQIEGSYWETHYADGTVIPT